MRQDFMNASIFEKALYIVLSLFIIYVFLSFLQVNMYSVDSPELISAHNFFKLIERFIWRNKQFYFRSLSRLRNNQKN